MKTPGPCTAASCSVFPDDRIPDREEQTGMRRSDESLRLRSIRPLPARGTEIADP
jgi:hypothetical protein